MKRTLKGSLYVLGAMIAIATIAIAVGVGVTKESSLYNPMIGILAALIFSSPIVMLVAIISGIGTLVNRGHSDEKRKREFTDFSFHDDSQLEEIMLRLSPEQQIYLDNKLRNNRLGVNTDDGELMSLDELMDDFDSIEKRM